MDRKPGHRPGDIILDHFVPRLGPEDREVARERLQQWMRWKLRIIIAQVRTDIDGRDSRDGNTGDTMESAQSPLP